MAPANPLNSLSGQLAASQGFALPALIVVYSIRPEAIPVILASLGGMHFLPYSWLHRTRVYAIAGGTVAIGGLAIQMALPEIAFSAILFLIAAVYAVAAPLVYHNARRLAPMN
jgi:hypothetical protein